MIIPNAILNQLGVRDPKQITHIFIHHSVFYQTADATQIAAMEPFLTIGYNSYIRKNPNTGKWECQAARPLNKIPAAQYGMNTEGYAICIAGNYQQGGASFLNQVEEESLDVAAAQIHLVKSKCPNLKYLVGHRDVAKIKIKQDGISQEDASSQYGTSCPGDLLYERLHDLRVMTGLHTPPELL